MCVCVYVCVCMCVCVCVYVCNQANSTNSSQLVQVDWEPVPTEIVPKWAPHLLRLVLDVRINKYEDG